MLWGRNSFLGHPAEADRNFSRQQRASRNFNVMLDRREGFQRMITPMFRTTPAGASMLHLRRRLHRWNLETLPGHRPGRARKVLEVLRGKATP